MKSLRQSPTDDGFVQNPYRFYDRARALGPLFVWEDYGLVCATSAAAVGAILRDRRFGREVPAEKRSAIPDHLAPFYAVEAHSMLELEPPRHTRLRNLVLRAFTSRRIAGLAPDITALATELAFPQTMDELKVGGTPERLAPLSPWYAAATMVLIVFLVISSVMWLWLLEPFRRAVGAGE